ncbi:MAG: ATP-grasp domain-containing protein, partial [Porticoccaceae bacterium]
RGEEKKLCQNLGVATADFALINSSAELAEALAQLGYPAILKTRREGYDGKGQVWLRSAEDLPAAAHQADATACVLEAVVPFQREISAIAARSIDGAISCFSLSENIHREGILRLTINRRNDLQQQQAEQLIGRLMEQLNYVGVLALELFDVADELRVNEMAPRVHNTGHWTPAGARHSQFEAHLLAVAGRSLPSLDWSNDCAMINIIGALPDQTAVEAVAGASLHLYGKTPRPGRKLGHINLVFAPHQSPAQRLDELRKLLRLVGEADIANQLQASWL